MHVAIFGQEKSCTRIWAKVKTDAHKSLPSGLFRPRGAKHSGNSASRRIGGEPEMPDADETPGEPIESKQPSTPHPAVEPIARGTAR